ncbi:MAG: HEAT repeat domain-containing protein [Oscillospiraceae bacterium]|nr:HEAT repeat domain-containing protein [Oscillospiraceae bacterium]
MNISPFYELRSRLYACAAAGCQTVNEDFRLKRAVEEFKPLAELNKAFGKLYSLCQSMFTAENASCQLADAIALADALAVTQGTFADNSEVIPTEVSVIGGQLSNAPYSVISEFCDKITKCSPNLYELSGDETALLGDPRVLMAFIKACGKNSTYLDYFSEMMFEIYGERLVPLLKNAVDMSDPKASGTAVEYVSALSGNAENAWFLSLAKDENAPQNVRIAAISALGKDSENVPYLLELYNTEKGKIKNAALDALVSIDSPEAEEVITKLIAKYKPSCDVHIAAACGKTATDFAVGLIKSGLTPKGYLTNESRRTDEYASLLANKPNADEGFLLLAKQQSPEVINQFLLTSLRRNNTEEYRALIHRLYAKVPQVFFVSEFFVLLMEDPENAVARMGKYAEENRLELLNVVNGIYYDKFFGEYCLDWRGAHIYGRYPVVRVTDSYPQQLIDLICDRRCTMSDKKLRYRTFSQSAEAALMLLNSCKPEDYERIRVTAVNFAFFLCSECPVQPVLEIIAQHYKDGKPSDYKGLITKCVLHSLKIGITMPVRGIDNLPLSESERVEEITALMNKMAALKGKIDDWTYNYQMRYINNYLNRK